LKRRKKSEGGRDAAGDAPQSEDEWTRFLKVDRNTVRVEWANGEITNEPRAEFEPQIPRSDFAYHAKIAKMPAKQQRDMLARTAKSRSKATASGLMPRATRSGRLVSGVICSVKKSKKARLNFEQKDESHACNLQTSLACVDISQTTCSYCGCVGILCFHCTAVASCLQRVCMQCWTLAAPLVSAMEIDDLPASSSSCIGSTAASDHFHC